MMTSKERQGCVASFFVSKLVWANSRLQYRRQLLLSNSLSVSADCMFQKESLSEKV